MSLLYKDRQIVLIYTIQNNIRTKHLFLLTGCPANLIPKPLVRICSTTITYTQKFTIVTGCFLVLYNIKMSSIKSSENIQKKEGGPDRSVSDILSSSVILNELAMKARKPYCNFKNQQRSHKMININPNVVQII